MKVEINNSFKFNPIGYFHDEIIFDDKLSSNEEKIICCNPFLSKVFDILSKIKKVDFVVKDQESGRWLYTESKENMVYKSGISVENSPSKNLSLDVIKQRLKKKNEELQKWERDEKRTSSVLSVKKTSFKENLIHTDPHHMSQNLHFVERKENIRLAQAKEKLRVKKEQAAQIPHDSIMLSLSILRDKVKLLKDKQDKLIERAKNQEGSL